MFYKYLATCKGAHRVPQQNQICKNTNTCEIVDVFSVQGSPIHLLIPGHAMAFWISVSGYFNITSKGILCWAQQEKKKQVLGLEQQLTKNSRRKDAGEHKTNAYASKATKNYEKEHYDSEMGSWSSGLGSREPGASLLSWIQINSPRAVCVSF